MNDDEKTCADLIKQLSSKGIRLWHESGKLLFHGPKEALTPTIKQTLLENKITLLEYLSTHSGQETFLAKNIHRGKRDEYTPLSYAQKRLWFLQQLDPNSAVYNVPMAAKLTGQLNIDALKEALQALIKRHEILRTTFHNIDGEPKQKIALTQELYFDLHRIVGDSNYDDALARITLIARQPFNLETGPLFRVSLITNQVNEHYLLLNMHHLVADGWSLKILGEELSSFYIAKLSNNNDTEISLLSQPSEINYVDFVYWEKQWINSDEAKKQLSYWKKQLNNLPTLNLPKDYSRPLQQTSRGDMISTVLPKEILQALSALSKKHGVTNFVMTLTIINILLAKYSGQDEIILATPVSTRRQHDLEHMIGTFMNTLVLRCKLSYQQNLNELICQIKEIISEAFDNQELPFDKLVDELQPQRNLNVSPLFQVLFLYENFPVPIINLSGLKTTTINIPLGTARFDLVILIIATERGLEIVVEYATDIFNADSIKRLIKHFENLLKNILLAPDHLIMKYSLLDEEEARLIKSFNATKQIFPDNNFVQIFMQVCRQKPTTLALVDKNQKITFAELDIRSNWMAAHLQKFVTQKSARIILCLPNSIEAIIAIIAVLKIGAAYIPIQQNLPDERLQHIIQQTHPDLIITQDTHIEVNTEVPIVKIEQISVEATNYQPTLIDNNDTAYIIFTSGSTGLPKGVAVSHRNLANLSYALEEKIYKHDKNIRQIALNGRITFDTSVKQLIQLLQGRTIHLITDEIRYDALSFISYLATQQIQAFDCTPSQCRLLIAAGLHDYPMKHKMMILVGGEAIDESLWKVMQQAKHIDYHNLYGPTECTVDATSCLVRQINVPMIGWPLPNVAVYILDENLQPAAIGVTGEIYISGLGVAKGYVGDAKSTQEKFLLDPFIKDQQSLMYRTGDRGRLHANGAIEFLDRTDHQVQIQGYRVELGEIEATLKKHPFIQNAIATLQPKSNGSSELIAYIQISNAHLTTIKNHKRYLLPNGLAVTHLNKHETDFLYKDIFEKNAYLRNGIVIHSNNIIFDVGSNIGLFALQAHSQAENIKIFTFEPNPFVRELLIHNLNLYHVNACIFDYALGEFNESAVFTFYPKMSFLSGLHANLNEEKNLIHSHINLTEDIKEQTEYVDDILTHHLEAKQFEINIKSISDVIAEHHIERIDLLKINVEKAEHSVLLGIKAEDWNKIQQIVVEIHDIDGRLKTIEALLSQNNFYITIEKDWSVTADQAIYYLYASRKLTFSNPKKMQFSYDLFDENIASTYLKKYLPHYMIPANFYFLEKLPLNSHGKIDLKSLEKISRFNPQKTVEKTKPQTKIQQTLAEIWQQVLKIENVTCEDNFFDLGGHSLLLAQVYTQLKKHFSTDLKLLDLFEYTTINALANRIQKNYPDETSKQSKMLPSAMPTKKIAIIGMAGRFPNSKNVEEFWQNLLAGKELTTRFHKEDLISLGVPKEIVNLPNYVPVRGIVDGIQEFDAEFFGFSPREAELLDPQQRLFLECAWEAFENAGYNITSAQHAAGIYAGQSISTYLFNNLLPHVNQHDPIESFQVLLANDKDHLATRTAYKLNLQGPSIAIQTACSTSLVAVHMACQALINGECDLALAGGSSIIVPDQSGYLYREGSILSHDGHCRAFDKMASGTLPANGVAAVILKPLAHAIRDNDTIHAVILGSAINNDGYEKIGYTAPSLQGQINVIQKALNNANIQPDSISYIETHGTGTALGDPIEISALERVFSQHLSTKQCAIGSVKTNIGHLDAAAGIASLIKVTMAIKNGILPPTLNFLEGNSAINWEKSPFYVVDKQTPWISNATPRRAGISSFGIGGTNAHLILEQPPDEHSQPSKNSADLFILSARNQAALQAICTNLLKSIQQMHMPNLSDIAYTLQVGRKPFPCRHFFVSTSVQEVIEALQKPIKNLPVVSSTERPIVFAFPGQGSQFFGMGKALYENFHIFKYTFDQCAELLLSEINVDIRTLLFTHQTDNENLIHQTSYTQPAVFAIEYALTKLLMACGIKPNAMIGHSLGEYVAACIAGVFTLQEAIKLIVKRSALMQTCQPGKMVCVFAAANDIKRFLKNDVEIAAYNAPKCTVISGTPDAIAVFCKQLQSASIPFTLLPMSQAFHSFMLDPILPSLNELFSQVKFQKPTIPYLSNYAGDWADEVTACDKHAWVKHTRYAVKFADNVQTLLNTYSDALIIEVGPGQTLNTLINMSNSNNYSVTIITMLKNTSNLKTDLTAFLEAIGKLWSCGVSINWQALFTQNNNKRVALPTYPFQRQRFWVESKKIPVPILLKEQEKVQISSVEINQDFIQTTLIHIWKEILGVTDLHVEDDFYSLGGNSLIALQLTHRVTEQFNIMVNFSEINEFRTINKLTNLLMEKYINTTPQVIEKQISELIELDPNMLNNTLDKLSEKEIEVLLSKLEAKFPLEDKTNLL